MTEKASKKVTERVLKKQTVTNSVRIINPQISYLAFLFFVIFFIMSLRLMANVMLTPAIVRGG